MELSEELTAIFSASKHGDEVQHNGYTWKVCVSRGRKMLERLEYISTDQGILKKVKGIVSPQDRIHYKVFFITDYGKEIETTCSFWHPNESYTRLNGSKTTNKWDFYEGYNQYK